MTVHENETINFIKNAVQIGSNVKNNLTLKGLKNINKILFFSVINYCFL